MPQETVNDDRVKIVGWKFADGALVRRGDVLAEIETSKSVVDVEAEADGFLEILSPAGTEVDVGAVLGRIHEGVLDRGLAQCAQAEQSPSAASDGQVAVSLKARRLMDQHGISPAVFAGLGLVRERDVLDYLRRISRGQAGASPAAKADDQRSGEELPGKKGGGGEGAEAAKDLPGGLLGDARASAKARGRSILWLAWNYAFRNWFLGHLARLAPRGVDLLVHRWRGVKIGRGCFVDPSATLETAYPENITLGDDVRVAAGAIIMTHIKGPHYLRQIGVVPSVNAPVVVEDHAFIGVNAVIMPGVTVGKASVVVSGAVVLSNVPPYTIVSGNPAKVVKRFPIPQTEKAP